MTGSIKAARRAIGDAIGRQYADAALEALAKAGLALMPKTLTPEIACALEDAAPPVQSGDGEAGAMVTISQQDFATASDDYLRGFEKGALAQYDAMLPEREAIRHVATLSQALAEVRERSEDVFADNVRLNNEKTDALMALAEAREVIEPFAKATTYYDEFPEQHSDDEIIWETEQSGVIVGDLRRARAWLDERLIIVADVAGRPL